MTIRSQDDYDLQRELQIALQTAADILKELERRGQHVKPVKDLQPGESRLVPAHEANRLHKTKHYWQTHAKRPRRFRVDRVGDCYLIQRLEDRHVAPSE